MRNRPNSALVQRADGSKALECGAEKLKKNHSKKKKGKDFFCRRWSPFVVQARDPLLPEKLLPRALTSGYFKSFHFFAVSRLSLLLLVPNIFSLRLWNTHTNQPTMLIAAIVLPPFVRKKISTIDSHGFGALFKIIVSTRMCGVPLIISNQLTSAMFHSFFSKIIVWPVCIAGDSFAPDRPDYLIGDTFPAIHYFFDLQTWGEVYQISFSHSTFSANGFSLYNGSDSYQFRSLLLIT